MVSILTLVRMCAALHVKCLLFLSNFNQNCDNADSFLVKICQLEVKSCNASGHDKANSGSLQLLSELHLKTIDTDYHILISVIFFCLFGTVANKLYIFCRMVRQEFELRFIQLR